MSNILCVSERTVLRRMVEYGLKIRNFSNISDDQLDSHVLALTNDYPFCAKTILRELLKGRGIIIQRYRFRGSMLHVSEVGIFFSILYLTSIEIIFTIYSFIYIVLTTFAIETN